MARAKKLKYLGGGFLPGIPARDLMSDEVDRYGYNKLMKSGLYQDNYLPELEEQEPELEEVQAESEED